MIPPAAMPIEPKISGHNIIGNAMSSPGKYKLKYNCEL